jgi:hypothetical protein
MIFPFQIPQIKLEKVVYHIVLHRPTFSFTAKHFVFTACEINRETPNQKSKNSFFCKSHSYGKFCTAMQLLEDANG